MLYRYPIRDIHCYSSHLAHHWRPTSEQFCACSRLISSEKNIIRNRADMENAKKAEFGKMAARPECIILQQSQSS